MATYWVHRENQKIAFDISGNGPLVICIPSIGDLRAEYRFLKSQLIQAGYRVATMDLRGQGESSPMWLHYSVTALGRDLLALIDDLQAGTAFVIGTSLGAAAAVWAAAEDPEIIAGLVLVGPAVRGDTHGLYRSIFNILFARPWGPALWVKYYSNLYTSRKPPDFEQYLNDLKINLSEPGRIRSVLKLALASKAPSEARLSRLVHPTLILMGSKDPDFKDPEAEARWIAEQIKAEVQIISGAGHYPHAEMPEIAAPLVINFLNQLSGIQIQTVAQNEEGQSSTLQTATEQGKLTAFG